MLRRNSVAGSCENPTETQRRLLTQETSCRWLCRLPLFGLVMIRQGVGGSAAFATPGAATSAKSATTAIRAARDHRAGVERMPPPYTRRAIFPPRRPLSVVLGRLLGADATQAEPRHLGQPGREAVGVVLGVVVGEPTAGGLGHADDRVGEDAAVAGRRL